MTFSLVNILRFLLLVSIFYGCKSNDMPEKLISEDVMAKILSETHVLESKVGRLNFNSYDSSSVAFQYLQKRIWAKYKADSSIYNDSYEYYARYPKKFSEIYTNVEKQLTEMQMSAKKNEKKDE